VSIAFEVAPVDVVNEALGQCGKDFITNLDDTTDPLAVKCKRYLASLLRTMLRDHDWNFAYKRVVLAQNATAPVSGFTYAYALPADCLFVRKVNSSNKTVWAIEERNLVTDEDEVTIEYTGWIDDPNLWDGSFYQAVVSYLSVRFAPAFNVDHMKAVDLYRVYQGQLWDAKAIDGQEKSGEVVECTELTDDIRE
jgi:hypothetical protein